MSILDAVRARLGTATVPVDGFNNLAEILTGRGTAVDALFVIPDGERSGNGVSNSLTFEQLVDVGVAVVVMVTTGAAKARAGEQLETLKELAKGQLIGWGCPGSRAPTEFRGATPLPIAPGRISLMLRFAVPTRIRVTRTGAPDA